MAKVRITLDVEESDIIDNGDGTLNISGAKRVPIAANPTFRLIDDYTNQVNMDGDSLRLSAGSIVKLMECDIDDDNHGQSLFQYEGINIWIPNELVILISGNLGPDART